MNPLIINTFQSGDLYEMLYLAAFFTSTAFFIISGVKNKYSFQLLWLISSTTTLFFILGNKFFAIAPGDWRYLLTDPDMVSHGAKTILGGLIGVIISSVLLAAWLKADIRLADCAAIGLPLSMAVTRLGCLYSGCCFGKPTGLPWGIQYGPGSHAFESQAAGGLISDNDLLSLSVHPVQIYDMLCCILIAVFIWKFAGFIRARGNRFALVFLLYGIARFFLEFLRDPSTTFYGADTFLGIKYLQWAILGFVILLGTVILIREKKAAPVVALKWPENPWTSKHIGLLLFLWIVYLALFNWLDALERTMAGLMLIPSLVMMFMFYAGRFILPQYRLLTSFVLLSCMLFMSQTYYPAKTSNKVRFFEVGAGGLLGRYYSETAQILYQPASPGGTDCEGNTYPPTPGYYYLSGFFPVEHAYRLYGINGSYNVRMDAHQKFTLGLNGFYGIEKESYSMPDTGTSVYVNYSNSIPMYAINPYFSYDMKGVGVDLGFHAGKYRMAEPQSDPTREDPVNTIPMTHFSPQLGLRLGPQNILYLDAKYCGGFPTCFPENKFSIGLASGLGRWNGTKLGAGYSTGGYYTTASIVIRDKVVLDITAMDKFWDEEYYDKNSRLTINFALRYRFGFKIAGLAKND